MNSVNSYVEITFTVNDTKINVQTTNPLEIYTYLDTNFTETVDKNLSADNTRVYINPDQNVGTLTISPNTSVCDTLADYTFTFTHNPDVYTTA
jgi:hypothetical protein